MATGRSKHCSATLNTDYAGFKTNVVQNAPPQKSPEEVKAHLVMLQRAVLEGRTGCL
jgi:hypothetical protein